MKIGSSIRNARVYLFPEDCEVPTIESFEPVSESVVLRDPSPYEPERHGLTYPLGCDAYAHHVGGYIFLALGISKRVIPKSALRREIDDRIKHYEKTEGKKPGASAMRQFKDDAMTALLPTALIDTKTYTAHIDRDNRALVVHTTSKPVCDLFVNTIREALGSLKVFELRTKADAINTVLRSLIVSPEYGWKQRVDFDTEVTYSEGDNVHRIATAMDSDDDIAKVAGAEINSIALRFHQLRAEPVHATIGDDLTIRKLKAGIDEIEQAVESVTNTEADADTRANLERDANLILGADAVGKVIIGLKGLFSVDSN